MLYKQLRTILPTEIGNLVLDQDKHNHPVTYYLKREDGGRAYFSETRALEMHEEWRETINAQKKLDFRDVRQRKLKLEG